MFVWSWRVAQSKPWMHQCLSWCKTASLKSEPAKPGKACSKACSDISLVQLSGVPREPTAGSCLQHLATQPWFCPRRRVNEKLIVPKPQSSVNGSRGPRLT